MLGGNVKTWLRNGDIRVSVRTRTQRKYRSLTKRKIMKLLLVAPFALGQYNNGDGVDQMGEVETIMANELARCGLYMGLGRLLGDCS